MGCKLSLGDPKILSFVYLNPANDKHFSSEIFNNARYVLARHYSESTLSNEYYITTYMAMT